MRCRGCRRACGDAQTSPARYDTDGVPGGLRRAGHIRRIARRRHPAARPYRVATTAPFNCPGPPPHPASRVRVWERKWERRSAASCGQMRSDIVVVAASIASDVRQRRQAADLFARALSSHRGGRRFAGSVANSPSELSCRIRAEISTALRLPPSSEPVRTPVYKTAALPAELHRRGLRAW